jgi:hypothetical protein
MSMKVIAGVDMVFPVKLHMNPVTEDLGLDPIRTLRSPLVT